LDIDGLRAVAVLPVLAYHVGIHSVPGGFIGVDIFFVISGFLITQVLLQDIDGGRFSLIKFYERRVRRILPALVVVAAVTFFVCARYSLPSEFIDFSKSLIAAALSVSNIYFWQTGGYFTAPALSKPLLHTWSLAVEEQFYVFWPPCLWFGAVFIKRHLLRATCVLMAVSLIVSSFGAFYDREAAFYLVDSRAWELLLGGVLALGAFPKPLGIVARNLLSACGLALIAISVFTIHSDMPFPGLLALPPCLGAFLVILAGRDGESIAGRLLSVRPLVFIGLISYSLYLWHWPLTVFQQNDAILLTGGSDQARKLIIIAASLACGTLSWWLVEQPFRIGAWRPARPMLFRLAAVASGVLIFLGALGWVEQGFPSRYSPQQLQIASYLNYHAHGMYRADQGCFIYREGLDTWGPKCLRLDKAKPNYLLVGDSRLPEDQFPRGLGRQLLSGHRSRHRGGELLHPPHGRAAAQVPDHPSRRHGGALGTLEEGISAEDCRHLGMVSDQQHSGDLDRTHGGVRFTASAVVADDARNQRFRFSRRALGSLAGDLGR
jgi:peptidoglycan/LPS O-acetylase OafA/YrhL